LTPRNSEAVLETWRIWAGMQRTGVVVRDAIAATGPDSEAV
jgi:hypothetical protein